MIINHRPIEFAKRCILVQIEAYGEASRVDIIVEIDPERWGLTPTDWLCTVNEAFATLLDESRIELVPLSGPPHSSWYRFPNVLQRIVTAVEDDCE